MDLFETHIALASEIEICVLTHSDMPYTALKKGEMRKDFFIYLYFIPSPSSHCTYKREEMSIAKSTEECRFNLHFNGNSHDKSGEICYYDYMYRTEMPYTIFSTLYRHKQ
ncbi:unnamed protein product [Chironomus riparius]|uniref:Uncharacterized protein n=1 Tax=Chironomus riparius TaxID=315576 RepID=A0A9N9S8W1_9DIPT|nr:unnamed protein product [Chironomus riparius]